MVADTLQSELYKPVSLPKVKSQPVHQANSSGTPFAQVPWQERSMRQISKTHGRSLEEIATAKTVIWTDEYGNLFGCRRLKGPPVGDPVVEYDQYSPRRLHVRGLKDNLGLNRALQASEMMRRHGLATERQTSVHKLKDVVVNGAIVSVEQWKHDVIAQKQGIKMVTKSGPIEIPAEEIRKYLEQTDFYVEEAEMQVGERIRDLIAINSHLDAFYAVNENGGKGIVFQHERFQSIADFHQAIPRLVEGIVSQEAGKSDIVSRDERRQQITEDLRTIATYMEKRPDYDRIVTSGRYFRDKMGEVFRWVNQYNRIKGDPEVFDAHNDADIKRYFSEYLPAQVGRFLARFHKIGLAHEFATAHNWSLVGTLYDLDSVHGKPLGPRDGEITDADICRDIKFTGAGLEGEIFNSDPIAVLATEEVSPISSFYFGFIHQTYPDLHDLSTNVKLRTYVKTQFLASYLKERYGKIEPDQVETIIRKYRGMMELSLTGYGYLYDWTAAEWQQVEAQLREQ